MKNTVVPSLLLCTSHHIIMSGGSMTRKREGALRQWWWHYHARVLIMGAADAIAGLSLLLWQWWFADAVTVVAV